jgi:outer membrane protein assembly factor BamB
MRRTQWTWSVAFIAALAFAVVRATPLGAQTSCSDAQLEPPAAPCPAITAGLFIAVADVTGDGKLDVVVVQNGAVPVLVGNGDGTFQCPTAPFMTGPATPMALATGDFNNDGKTDVAVAADTKVYVSQGTSGGIGPFTAYTPGGTPPMRPTALAVLDAEWIPDGDLDIVASEPIGLGSIRLLRNDGSGLFAPAPSALFSNQRAEKMLTGDFNDDDRPDLVLFRNFTVGIALNNPSGIPPFLAPTTNYTFSGAQTTDVAAADFDRDGLLDVAAATGPSPDRVSARLGDGTGVLGSEIQSPVITAVPGDVVVGEYNGDSYPDIAVTHPALTDVDLAIGMGNGSFAAGPSSGAVGGTPSGVASGDLNGDGLDDVVLLTGNIVYVSVNTTGTECVRFVTARATGGATPGSGVNDLEWTNPSPFTGVRILCNPGSAPDGTCLSTDYPATATSGTPISPETAFAGAGHWSFNHTALDPGTTTYCYSLFATPDNGATFSPRQEISSRPFNSTTGPVRWAFSTGAASLAPPGNGIGRVHANANNNAVFAMAKGPATSGGGLWPLGPPDWKPKAMNAPSQGRPSTLAFPIGSASRVIFVGSQDGYVYALDADTGAQVWRSPELGASVQAQPSAFLKLGGGNNDYVLVGSRNADANNVFYALHASDGRVAWKYTGLGDGLRIGPINGQAAVDYANGRVYFTSRKRLATAPDSGLEQDNGTVWALSLDGGAWLWTAAVGDVEQAPTLRGDRLYVASNDGKLHALDVANGQEATGWPWNGGDGRVKGYAATDRYTQDLYFSTTSTVWKVADSPSGPQLRWPRGGVGDTEIVSPSTPVFVPGTTVVYVGTGGSGNGRLYRLDAATGATLPTDSFYSLGTGNAQIGSPTIDIRANTLYVGSDAGVIYAITLP